MTNLVFAVHGVAATTASQARSTRPAHWVVVAPTSTALAIRAIASHVACVTADTADDAGSVVLLLRAVVLAVSNLATVLASLVFIIAERSVQGSKLTELVALQLVLAFGN